MNSKAPSKKSTQRSKSYLSAAWPAFQDHLVAVLSRLEEDQYLILTVKCTDRFLQFAGQGAFGLRVETTSNSYLAKSEWLNRRQMNALEKLGWCSPTGSPKNATPERDPDGSPNFFREFPHPVPFEETARFAVKTLAEILRVPHPAFLQYEAFDATNRTLTFPMLGLMSRRELQAVEGKDSIAAKLLETLRESTEIYDLDYDENGDISVCFGSAVILARVVDDPVFVRLYSPMLSDIEASPVLLEVLNDLSANMPFTRFVHRNDTIYGIVDVMVQPYVPEHVMAAFREFTTVADGLDDLLQQQFGGGTAVSELTGSSRTH